jgi:serine/threonine protein phosphatase PrpC
MACAKCGAELRPTARFCNRCGTPVANTSDSDRANGASRLSAPATQPLDIDIETARASVTSQPSEADALADEEPTWVHPRVGARQTADAGGPSAHTEGVGLLPAQAVLGVDAAGMPVFGADDALPWPLPSGIIMDGRYRVEAVTSTSEEMNAYFVTDLRGYEQCWACGQVYGADGASERYCRECGADLLGRQLAMRERHATSEDMADESAGAPLPLGGGPDVPADKARTFRQGGRAYLVEPKVIATAAFPLGARLVAGAATDLGRRRSGEQNEDSAFVLVLDRLHENHTLPFGVFVVADGLGGHASGQRASRLVVNVLAHTILRQVALPVVGMPTDSPVDESHLANMLADAVRAANSALCAANRENDLDAGSTVVAALIYGETAYVANVGDSRAYVCDDAGIRRITSDHSLVQQLVAGGLIQPEEVYTHPQRNQIFRSLGDDPDLVVDLYMQQLKPGMRLLLCSDGLWEMVRDPEIEEVVRAETDPQSACDALIAASNAGGGDDNITAVVVIAR